MGSQIHPSAVIDKKALLGNDVVIGPHCCIEEGVTIGDGTVLDANVVIGRDVKIGKNNTLYAGCTIGRPPQLLGLKQDAKVGGLQIGDGNVIREQVTIHPSMHVGRMTSIGSDCLLMVGVHIGHDCELENRIVMSNYTQVSGHCRVETGVWLSGMVAVHQFVTFGKWCYAAGYSGINHDVPPFVIVSGHYPLQVRSVNKRGMDRAGLDDRQKKLVTEVFKRIYLGKGVFIDRVRGVAAEDSLDENVRSMIDSILRSSQHRFGRYLELFR